MVGWFLFQAIRPNRSRTLSALSCCSRLDDLKRWRHNPRRTAEGSRRMLSAGGHSKKNTCVEVEECNRNMATDAATSATSSVLQQLPRNAEVWEVAAQGMWHLCALVLPVALQCLNSVNPPPPSPLQLDCMLSCTAGSDGTWSFERKGNARQIESVGQLKEKILEVFL